jgi:hypothetical protein
MKSTRGVDRIFVVFCREKSRLSRREFGAKARQSARPAAEAGEVFDGTPNTAYKSKQNKDLFLVLRLAKTCLKRVK